MSSTALLVWNSTENTLFTSLGDSWQEYTGRPLEALVGDGWREVLHPDDRTPVIDAFKQARAAPRDFTITCRLLRHDGHYRRFLMTGIVQEAGRYLGTFTDLAVCKISEPSALALQDEQRRALAALREAEERFRSLFKNSTDLIYSLDLNGTFTAVNPAGARLLGYSAEDLIGRPALVVVVPEQHHLMQEQLENKLRGHEHAVYELDVVSKDGRRLTLEINSHLVRQEGVPIGIEGIARDISDRRRREQYNAHLRDFAGELAGTETPEEIGEIVVEAGMRLTEGGLSSVWLVTPDGQSIERLYAAGLDEAHVGKYPRLPLDGNTAMGYAIKHRQVVWIETQDEFIRRNPGWEALIREQDLHSVLCLPFFGKDGGVTGGMYVSYAGAPKRLTAEERSFFLAMAQICAAALERSRLAEQARELAATRERHRLAHSLHDSVTQTLFAASVLIDALPERWQGNSGDVAPEVERLRRLTRGAMAEMRALQLELRPERLSRYSLGQLLRQLAAAVRARKDVQVEIALSADPVLPPYVKEAIYRIAQEIFKNIIQHSQATTIFVELNALEEGVQLKIHDNGRGFDPQESAGGIGLEKMRARATAVNAELSIDSDPGEGTLVRLGWEQMR